MQRMNNITYIMSHWFAMICFVELHVGVSYFYYHLTSKSLFYGH